MKTSIKQVIACSFLLFSFFYQGNAQTLSASRRVDWSVAGYGGNTPSYPSTSILIFGADTTGIEACNNALANAIQNAGTNASTIYFPAGTYFFNQSISLPGNIVLKGAGAGKTKLVFNLNGALEDLIKIEGSADDITTDVTTSVAKGANSITVENAAAFAPGDYIKINQNDAGLITSAWAQGCIGQLVQIESVNGNNIQLKSALRKAYSVADQPMITRLSMQTGNGIECLTIKRMDATSWQSSNIIFRYAAKCWVKGVESDSCNYAHICLENASNVDVSASYFHGAFAYGGNGQGYGVLLQGTSNECLVENNVFKHLRHSMLLQAGANGNVMAYNYSIEPYWTDVTLLPADAAGDMVLHGNWPYANLFEGNIGQNMTIDNSHGKNGNFNTFFRNRGCNYGFFMNDAAGDSSNIIGNEITHPVIGLYLVTGNGNYTYGNNIKGIVSPLLTLNMTMSSLYRTSAPAYFANQTYPSVGLPNTISSGSIPAVNRYTAGIAAACGSNNIPLITLPITLMDFTATASGNYVDLNWKANDETGDSYIAERSFDGVNFSKITMVEAKGNTTTGCNYLVTTWQPQPTAWYRLQTVDKDGTVNYSKQIQITIKQPQKNGFYIITNPVISTLLISCNMVDAASTTFTISNTFGSAILQKNITLDKGATTLQQDVHALASGMYFIRFTDGAGKLIGEIQKMIKL